MENSLDRSERLQKAMARLGIASRRHAEILISQGSVKVNGIVVTQLGTKVYPEDVIEVSESTYSAVSITDSIYIMLNKPVGIISSVTDPHRRKTVIDLINQDIKTRVYPVGRLDYDTSGLLLLTNDGELTHRLTHPRYGVEKVYHVWIKEDLLQAAVNTLRTGVTLEDGRTAPAKLRKLCNKSHGHDRECTVYEIVIHEGRNRQVRRMFEQVGYPVIRLQRIAFGPLRLDPAMKAGDYRYLKPREIAALKKAVEVI
ncbi:rRNA pseudouridine synthase [Dehalobacter sp. DCM]|uniref:pseudouridine synthase n=1 Tax=Dehalobacter sp. DCM TaxID=2907827 RepID=UPI003081F691|nr:rRNA pseudouridine synthase [Dehalobacter sp. DCM]